MDPLTLVQEIIVRDEDTGSHSHKEARRLALVSLLASREAEHAALIVERKRLVDEWRFQRKLGSLLARRHPWALSLRLESAVRRLRAARDAKLTLAAAFRVADAIVELRRESAPAAPRTYKRTA